MGGELQSSEFKANPKFPTSGSAAINEVASQYGGKKSRKSGKSSKKSCKARKSSKKSRKSKSCKRR